MRMRIAWLGLLLLLTACGRVDEDLSRDPIYAQMVGKTYRTKMDLMVHTSLGMGKKRISLREIGTGDSPDRSELNKPFPFRYYDMKILGILPAATEFKIVKVKQEGSTGMNFTWYQVQILKSADMQWVEKIVYPMGMTDYSNKEPVPKFEEKYVEEIPEQP